MTNGYDASLVVARLNEDVWRTSALAIFAMGFGFVQYAFCLRMTLRDHVSPFPIAMHAFYLAHDLLYVFLFKQWFYTFDAFLFKAIWFGMVAFNLLEIHALYVAVRDDRQNELGKYYRSPVSVWRAALHVLLLAVGSFVIIASARSFAGDTLMLCVFVSTNVIMAVVPFLALLTRRRRVGGTVGLAITILLGSIATFLPSGFGFYTTADPGFFSRPWFFILGAMCVAVSCLHVLFAVRLPTSDDSEAL